MNLPLNFCMVNSHVAKEPEISHLIWEKGRPTTSVLKPLQNAENIYSTINKKCSNDKLDYKLLTFSLLADNFSAKWGNGSVFFTRKIQLPKLKTLLFM